MQKSKAQRVKINSASPEEVAMLHGIGERRAKLIVAYKKANGFFTSPDDLARVKGITLNLAISLAPHIDWEQPIEPEEPNKKDWISAFYWSIICLIISLSILQIALIIFTSSNLNNYTESDPETKLKVAISICGIATLFCFLIFAITRTSVAIISSKARTRRVSRFGLIWLALSLGFGFLIILGAIVYYQFYSPYGWTEIKGSQSRVIFVGGLVCFAFLLLFVVPQLIAWRRPDLITKRWLSGIFDFGIMAFGLLLILGFRSNILNIPLWLLILISITGGIVVIISFISIRRGETFFCASLDFIDPRIIAKHNTTIDDWRMWINSHLPDPEEQKALKKALDIIYQTSPTQTLLQFLVLSIGGWLVLTALDAIVQLYVQQWWTSLFK